MTQLQFVHEKIFRKAETFRNRVELTTFLEETVAPVEEDISCFLIHLVQNIYVGN